MLKRYQHLRQSTNRKDIDTLQDLYKVEPLQLRRKRNLVKIMFKESLKDDNLHKSKTLMQLQSAKNTTLKS